MNPQCSSCGAEVVYAWRVNSLHQIRKIAFKALPTQQREDPRALWLCPECIEEARAV
jgi:hypothetical protein